MNSNWLMVAILIVGLALAWVAGRMGAQSLVDSEAVVAELAPKVFADSSFGTAVQRSKAVAGQVESALGNSLRDGSFAKDLFTDSTVAAQLDDSVARSLYEGPAKQVLAEVVQQQLASVRAAAPAVKSSAKNAGVDSAQLAKLQRTMRGYEQKLATLATEVNDDESAAAVNSLQGQLFEMQTMLNGLSKDVRCVVAQGAGTTRSFLLKERRSTQLSGVDLLVTLGRLRKGMLNSVAISGRNPDAGPGEAQGTTAVKANVRIGKPFNFTANGRIYEGTFTYSQGRWGPDFVGFEMHETAGADAEDC